MADVVTPALLRQWALPEPGGGKASRGHTLVVGGSPSTPGAVMLAGLGALRVGTGVLALAVAESCAPAVAAATPEAAVLGIPLLDGRDGFGPAEHRVADSEAVLVGPGLDDPDLTKALLSTVLDGLGENTYLAADAFALGVLPEFADRLPRGRTVLTPNAAEVRFLLPEDDPDAMPGDEVAATVAGRYGAVVSFRDHVADPDGRHWVVASGHAGLGTSGSGDVLAGAVTGLLARGATAAQAACWGTYLHATAGDRLASRIGRLGFLARELADELAHVLTETQA